MLSLALFRHAKSSWDNPGVDDFDRPLNERGRKAAPVMGRVIADLAVAPDLILCSPAKRTRETLELARPEFTAAHCETRFDENLYLPNSEDLLARIRSIGNGHRSVLVIGHNPGLHGLALKLAGTGDAKALNRLEEKFPTGSLAIFTFEPGHWRDVAPATGRLEAFVTPRERG